MEIAVLDASLDDGGWPATFDAVLGWLSKIRAVGVRISFSENDVDQWDWKTQAITLSHSATQRLLAALPAGSELRDSVRQMKKMHERLEWGNAIGLSLHTRGFLVSLRGESIYGGVFLEAVSERRVDFPVLRTSLVDGRAGFHILPVHLPFLMVDPGSPDQEVTIDQAAPEGRADFPIAKMFVRQANGPEAARIRYVIFDSRLHSVLEQTGKLARQ